MIIKRHKGMTVVEVIISLALLGILSVVFINAFTMGFTKIIYAGHRTNAVGQAQAHFYENPSILAKQDIKIEIPTTTSDIEIIVSGSYATGNVTLNPGPAQEIQVEVLTFVPGLSQD